MFTIRTTLVVAAFVAAGLFSAAEYLARATIDESKPFVSVNAGSRMPGTAVEMTKRVIEMITPGKGEPWI